MITVKYTYTNTAIEKIIDDITTSNNIVIGVAMGKQNTADNFLEEVRRVGKDNEFFDKLIQNKHKSRLEFANGVSVRTSRIDGNTFRGMTVSKIYIDPTLTTEKNLIDFTHSNIPSIASLLSPCITIMNDDNQRYGLEYGYHYGMMGDIYECDEERLVFEYKENGFIEPINFELSELSYPFFTPINLKEPIPKEDTKNSWFI